jgi:perosamine synthetase
MSEKFIIPKEPRLLWNMLLPSLRHNRSFPSLNGRPIHYLFWARNAMYHGLAALGIQPGDNVLVPAFHCTSVVEPILKYGSEAKFFDINADLSPNFDDIKAKIDRRTRAIVAIHYFGFPQPIQKLRELCHAHNLYLIEDCAHVLTGKTPDGTSLGDAGDISIFSWRKFLPVYDGGQLVINNPKLTLDVEWEKGDAILSLKIVKNTFERLFADASGSWLRRVSSFFDARSFLFRSWMTTGSAAQARMVNSYEVTFNADCLNLSMSGISRCILERTNIKKVVEDRRRNYQRLGDVVQTLRGVTLLHPTLPEDVCPWVFPLLVDRVKDLHVILRARGIPATTWGGVIHRSLPLERFPIVRMLYDNLVFLPIHQSLKLRDLQMLGSVLRQTLDERISVDEKNPDDCIPLSAVSGR